jgi:hypothetical protein
MLDWVAANAIVESAYDSLAAAARIRNRGEREAAFDQLERDLTARVKEAKKDRDALKQNPADAAAIAARNIANTLMNLMAPTIRRVQNACDRAQQLDHNLAVAIALAAYRAENGKYPAKLDHLAPKYLPVVPLDLYRGRALIYKPDDKGYLLYSVGPNGKDEGGKRNEPDGDDLSVRMPLPPLKKDK